MVFGDQSATGNASVGGELDVSGQISSSGSRVLTFSDLPALGIASGAAGVISPLVVGNAVVGGVLNVTGAQSNTGNLSVGGNLAVAQEITSPIGVKITGIGNVYSPESGNGAGHFTKISGGGIGINLPSYDQGPYHELDVNGSIRARERLIAGQGGRMAKGLLQLQGGSEAVGGRATLVFGDEVNPYLYYMAYLNTGAVNAPSQWAFTYHPGEGIFKTPLLSTPSTVDASNYTLSLKDGLFTMDEQGSVAITGSGTNSSGYKFSVGGKTKVAGDLDVTGKITSTTGSLNVDTSLNIASFTISSSNGIFSIGNENGTPEAVGSLPVFPIAVGYGNSIGLPEGQANPAAVFGHGNQIFGFNSYAFGWANSVTGSASMALGFSQNVAANGIISVGPAIDASVVIARGATEPATPIYATVQGPLGRALVGIGMPTGIQPTHMLEVHGTIQADRLVLPPTGSWPDRVFEADYTLTPLSEVERHISEEKHLPGVPSAQEVAANGVDVVKMQSVLLEKIEELTLHVIAQEKRIIQLENENETLKRR